jgi:acylphosphatase
MGSIHLEVRGRVQGVGFRWYVVEKAQQLQLSGWVRNNSNGNVELVAAGPADALTRLETAVRSGPRGARVDHVMTLAPPSADGLPKPFEIAR